METKITSKEIYNGKIIHVTLDDVVLDDGKKTKREVVYHNGGCCIALRDKDGKYFMVKQYRYALGKDMLEFTAGKIEKGEDPDETILREAIEETGFEAINVHKLGTIVPTCGYSSEKISLYFGEAGRELGQHFDEHERITLYKYSFAEIKEMIKNGEIDDAKTIAAMFYIEMAGLDA